MNETLLYLHADLRTHIAALCSQLRRQSYPNPGDEVQNALHTIVYYQLLEDELSILLDRETTLILAMEKHLKGEPFSIFPESDLNTYQYCLTQFDPALDCPLGSASEELRQWFLSHADRQLKLREALDTTYPNIDFMLVDKRADEGESLRSASAAELFNLKAYRFLRDIEDSNALEEFSERMRQVRQMLMAEVTVASILTVIRKPY